MRQIYDLKAQGRSIRGIARAVGASRNTVRKYLRSPGLPQPKPRRRRVSKLAPYFEYVQQRLAQGVWNCVVLLRELKARGYPGGYTILKDYVKPFRRPRQPVATARFETQPGEQAQVDWGCFGYTAVDGRKRRLWAFVMVLSWSRWMYLEFVSRVDLATFIRCHLNAFERLGGVPRTCLYDQAKVVVLGRDGNGEPLWNPRFFDFALRLGFMPRLCRPYRAQTKGRVESGIKYVKNNFWPAARFVGCQDLNLQGQQWTEAVANQRVHGTTRQRPADMVVKERPYLLPLPPAARLAPFLREERRVGRDGYVQWEGAWYGVPWQWAGRVVEV
ncbi:MAG: IS21 family transposase, partial [Acetobacteraceae bacterium]|nr:IS21 family transposase [Acetobacteraceae bacterium]